MAIKLPPFVPSRPFLIIQREVTGWNNFHHFGKASPRIFFVEVTSGVGIYETLAMLHHASGCTKPWPSYITRQSVRNRGHVTSRVRLYETLSMLQHASGCTKPCRCYITRQAVQNLVDVTSRVRLHETVATLFTRQNVRNRSHVTSCVRLYKILAMLHHVSSCTKPWRCYITYQAVQNLGDVTSRIRLYKTLAMLHHVSSCTKPWRCYITCQAVRNLGGVTSRVRLYETVAVLHPASGCTKPWRCGRSFKFSIALRPQRPYGLLETGAQDVHLHFHTASELCGLSGLLTILWSVPCRWNTRKAAV